MTKKQNRKVRNDTSLKVQEHPVIIIGHYLVGGGVTETFESGFLRSLSISVWNNAVAPQSQGLMMALYLLDKIYISSYRGGNV